MIIKTIERNRRFISLGNCGTLFLSIQGHRFIDEPIIKPTNIIRIFSLYFLNNHFNIGISIIIPVNAPEMNNIKYTKFPFFTALRVTSYIPIINNINAPLIPGSIIADIDNSPANIINNKWGLVY